MKARHTLLMPLAGPMQSWGYRSRFDDRDTGLEPTRSGILGLLCAACGIERKDTIKLQEMDSAIRLGVRIDAPGRVMVDFHTAQNVLTASGGLQETVTSHRYYLADARFLVGLESEDLQRLRGLEAHLRDPVWTLCLGRKSFPLTLPPYLPDGSIRENTTLVAALRTGPWFALKPGQTPPFSLRYVVEEGEDIDPRDSEHGITMTLGDRPLDFEKRRFGLRRVIVFDVFDRRDTPPIEEGLCISPN